MDEGQPAGALLHHERASGKKTDALCLVAFTRFAKAPWTFAEKCLLHSLKGTHAGSVNHAVAASPCAGLLFLAPPGIKVGAIALL